MVTSRYYWVTVSVYRGDGKLLPRRAHMHIRAFNPFLAVQDPIVHMAHERLLEDGAMGECWVETTCRPCPGEDGCHEAA